MTAIVPLHSIDDIRIAVIGLGYVGLPLAVEFGKQRSVVGFDINAERIAQLRAGVDRTLEVETDELAEAQDLSFSSDAGDLGDANFYIVTVPTPIDSHRQPDLTPLIKASETIGKVLKPSDIVETRSGPTVRWTTIRGGRGRPPLRDR